MAPGGCRLARRGLVLKQARARADADADGSSSGKLLVQRIDPGGALGTVLDQKIGIALGKGVQNGQPIPQENQDRALKGLQVFLDEAKKRGVSPGDVALITAAVVRNASNGDAFLGRVHGLGLTQARVLSGTEEDEAGFFGALAMLGGKPGRYATLDQGGGSFQMAVGTEAALEQGGSTQLGSNYILDSLVLPRSNPDGTIPPGVFALVDAELKTLAPMPLPTDALMGRTLMATGGVSKFLRAHLGKDAITRAEVEGVRQAMAALSFVARAPVVQRGKSEDTKVALGIETHEGAVDYARKLPASASLLLHIMDALGLHEVRVSETDARHALTARAAKA